LIAPPDRSADAKTIVVQIAEFVNFLLPELAGRVTLSLCVDKQYRVIALDLGISATTLSLVGIAQAGMKNHSY
jgi:hypothetical protein